MRSLNIPESFIRRFALAGLLTAVAADAIGAPPPLRTANARIQVAQVPPPAPIPDPPPPGGLQSVPVPSSSVSPMPGAPVAPVPPPEPGGAMYSVPFGTMREQPPPPPKVYTGDPGGIGSNRSSPNSNTPTPLDPNQPLPALDANPMVPTTDRFGVAPPPGTLGQTYHRRSQLTDEKKHPRAGIVEVHLSENYDVSALGLKSKWTGKVWRLESDPLLPGIPHIFEVKAEWGPEDNKKKEVRTVRLIMGRIVDLDF